MSPACSAPLAALAGAGPDAAHLRIGGWVSFSTVDFPGRLSAVAFVQGCPWRCGYCHNPHLQPRHAHTPGALAWPQRRDWLARRTGLLDAMVFSGGEPTLDAALGAAMADVRALGLGVGLHSAGLYPRRLREVLPLVDWIGLDIKAPLDEGSLHDRVTGVAGSARPAALSLAAVLASGVPHEVRTTVDGHLVDEAALLRLGAWLAARGVRHYAVQVARHARTHAGAPAWRPTQAAQSALGALFEHFTLREG